MSTALLEAPGAPWTELSDDEPGDHPARLRLKVTDTSGNNQLSVIWGLRSRYYDSAATAALFYQAEALTPVNGAAVTGLSGASGGNVVTIKSLPAATWVTMLSTTISATTGNLTHQGSYRVWARCYSATGTPQFQFLWGVGSLSVPVSNTAVTLPNSGAFYLLDLGEVRIDPPPVGTAQWLGAVQVYSAAGGDSASVDCIYLQPLDDGAGQLTYVNEPPASSIEVTASPTTGVNDALSGTVAWEPTGNPLTNIYADDGLFARVDLTSNQVSNWGKAMGFGFAIPSGATIKGIQVLRYGGVAVATSVRLVKAGTIQTADAPTIGWQNPSWHDAYGNSLYTWGGATDLWNTTWSASDVNNAQFGCALQYTCPPSTSISPIIDWIQVAVWYTLASGFTVVQDAVIYGDETLEVRHDGMWRQGPSSGPYGTVSQIVGDLARMPPSGMENRPCQIFIKPTRGDLNTLPDSGLDGFTVQPIVRPSWIFRP